MYQKKYLLIPALPFLLSASQALGQEPEVSKNEEKPQVTEDANSEAPSDSDEKANAQGSETDEAQVAPDKTREGESSASAEIKAPSEEKIQLSAPATPAPKADGKSTKKNQPPEFSKKWKTSHKDPAPEPREEADEEAAEEAVAASLTDIPEEKPGLTPLKVTTSVWSRFEVRENYDNLGVSRGRFQEGDRTFFRARLGLQTNPLALSDSSDVFVKVAPQATGTWGQDGSVGEANAGLYEAFVKLRTERLDIQIGRFMMSYGDEQLIGSLDWNQVGRAFDGVRSHYKMNHGYLDMFVTQVSEGNPQGDEAFLGGDSYFWGGYAGLGEYFKDGFEGDLYFLGLSQRRQEFTFGDDDVNAQGAHLFTAGARVADKIDDFDYRAEVGFQFGSTVLDLRSLEDPSTAVDVENRSVRAFQGNAELGWTFASRTRLGLGGGYASGDDPFTTGRHEGWNHLFPTGHRYLGLTDVIGARTNIASGRVQLKQSLGDSLTATVVGHVFARPESGGLGSRESGLAGSEVNAQLRQKIGDYVQVRGLYGLFMPSSGHYARDDLVHFGELQAGINY